MKRVLVIALIISLLSICTANTKSGDVAGVYYSTDILTTLNGNAIDAINIGGETLISAEDMRHYGFSVVWDAEARTLEVNLLSGNTSNDAPLVTPKPNYAHAGTVIGHYYETDIVTSLDGTPITAYNIGGRTYMHAEEMRNFGYKVDWSAEKWTLSITTPDKAGYIYSMPLYSGLKQTEEGKGLFLVHYQNGEISSIGDTGYFDLTFARNKNEYSFTLAFYQNQGLLYSSKLIQYLDSLCYDGLGIATPCNPEEKYDEIDKSLYISINGNDASEIEIYKGGGNGHRDYYITVKDMPLFEKDEITDIHIFTKNFAVGS